MSKTELTRSRYAVLRQLYAHDKRLKEKWSAIESKVFVPKDIRREYKDLQHIRRYLRDLWEELSKERLRLKFKYFNLKIEGNENAREAILNDEFVRTKSANELRLWKKYTLLWDELEDLEERAYVSRVLQHRDTKHVHKTWYQEDLEEFEQWAERCKERMRTEREKLVLKQKDEVIPNFVSVRELVTCKSDDLYLESAYSWLQERVLEAVTCLTEMLYHLISKNEALCTPLCLTYKNDAYELTNRIVELFGFFLNNRKRLTRPNKYRLPGLKGYRERIKTRLFSEILEEVSNAILRREGKDYVVEKFLERVKDSHDFKCQFCDFLEVQGTKGNRRLEVFASTVKGIFPPEIVSAESPMEAYKELREKEAYKEQGETGGPEGISGSIFVEPRDKVWFHVGTNCLDKDYRQSVEHTRIYTKHYGDIYNFWLFPIYEVPMKREAGREKKQGKREEEKAEEPELKYALRVVNKLDPYSGCLVEHGWQYLTRLQLCELARWFGNILRMYTDLSWFTGLLDEMRESRLELDWIEDKTLEEAINHVMTVAFRKVESRRLGCTIVIIGEESEEHVDEIEKTEKSDLDLSNKRLEEITSYYDAMSSQTNCVLIGEDLRVRRVYRYSTFRDLIESLGKFTKSGPRGQGYPAITLHLQEGTETIQIIQEGDVQGEIYFSERSGNWKFRHYDTILNRIFNNVSFFQDKPKREYEDVANALKATLRLATDLSRFGYGALIVFGDEPIRWEPFEDYSHQDLKEGDLKEGIGVDNIQELIHLARMDGATIITTDGKLVMANVKIINSEDIERKARNLPPDDPYKEIYDGRGTRHKTGILTSMECKQAVLFVVSQNKGITILCKDCRKANVFPIRI